jgi:hypothetical protein
MKKPNISEEGRRRQGIAGQRNIREWQIREAQAQQTANEKVERFRREMYAEFDGNPGITERTMIDSAATSLLVITLAEIQLQQVPSRLKRKKGLAAAIAAHQNSLLRCIRALNSSKKTKRAPRTIEEVLEQHRVEVAQ